VTRTELRRGSDVKERILDAILSSRVQSRTLPSRQQIKTFLSEYFAHVPYEDLQGRDEKIMARAAISHLDFGAVRRKGQPLIRFFNPTLEDHGYESAFSFVEMVNDDMPFIVDSVLAAINRQGLTVHLNGTTVAKSPKSLEQIPTRAISNLTSVSLSTRRPMRSTSSCSSRRS
jgi:glutamate dehydrogenase